MPMTAEEQAQFDTMKAEKEKAEKELKDLRDNNNPPAPQKKENDPSVLEAIRKKEQEDREKSDKEKRILEGAKFIATFDKLIADGGEFFPKEVSVAVEIVNKRKYDDEISRADDLRASIIESVFSVQKNLDLLTELGKQKVNDFLALSQTAKQKNSEAIWEYVLNALDTYKRVEKQTRTEAARRGLATPSGATEAYEKKIFGLRNKTDKKGA